MCSEFRHYPGFRNRGPIDGKDSVNRANGLRDNVPAPHIGALFEQPLERLLAESLTARDRALFRRKASIIANPSAQMLRPGLIFGDGLIA